MRKICKLKDYISHFFVCASDIPKESERKNERKNLFYDYTDIHLQNCVHDDRERKLNFWININNTLLSHAHSRIYSGRGLTSETDDADENQCVYVSF